MKIMSTYHTNHKKCFTHTQTDLINNGQFIHFCMNEEAIMSEILIRSGGRNALWTGVIDHSYQ